MTRWKTTENILSLKKDGEIFDPNWMDCNSISQYAPPAPKWAENRRIKFEDVDVWEVIYEQTGPIGIYAAWCPYSHYFVVMDNWSIVGEYWGVEGEKSLVREMSLRGIECKFNTVWIDDINL